MSDVPKTLAEVLEEQRQQEQHQLFRGFTLAELRTLFNAICDPKDWRAPIRATVRPGPGATYLLRKIDAAVAFFTATKTEVREVVVDGMLDHFELTSIGYRAGPAGL